MWFRERKAGQRKAAPAADSIAGLIARITGRPVQPNLHDANLETDLHLTSLDRVELMSALEERHQVDLNEAQFQDVTTVAQLEKLLARGSFLSGSARISDLVAELARQALRLVDLLCARMARDVSACRAPDSRARESSRTPGAGPGGLQSRHLSRHRLDSAGAAGPISKSPGHRDGRRKAGPDAAPLQQLESLRTIHGTP